MIFPWSAERRASMRRGGAVVTSGSASYEAAEAHEREVGSIAVPGGPPIALRGQWDTAAWAGCRWRRNRWPRTYLACPFLPRHLG
jgi:hypothetical protein